MNEDDTYDALRRVPFKTLMPLLNDQNGMFDHAITDDFTEKEIEWLHTKGWSLVDFLKGWREYKSGLDPQIQSYSWWNEVTNLIRELENE